MRILCSELGGDPDYWLYRVSEASACWLLREISAHKRRSIAGKPGEFDPDSPRVQTTIEYGLAVDRIRARIRNAVH